jgi:Domain of unknown function (DUF4401)
MDANITWTRLVEAGLARGDMPDPGQPAVPWYLRALAGVAAWIAAVCVLSSVGLLFVRAFDHAWSSIVVGVVLCVAGGMVLTRVKAQPFVAQFALAIVIAGEVAIGIGVMRAATPHYALGWALVAVVEIGMLFAIADRTHRALSALAVACAGYFALERVGLIPLMPPIVAIAFVGCALAAERDARSHALLHPAAAGVAVGLLAFAPFATIAGEAARWRHLVVADVPAWLPEASMALIFVAVVAILLRRIGVADMRMRTVALGGAVGVAALGFPVPGLLAALVVMFVAFATGRPALTGLGIVCAVSMLGYYYYSLVATLLAKSVSLIAVGAVLLATGAALRHLARAAEGEAHA